MALSVTGEILPLYSDIRFPPILAPFTDLVSKLGRCPGQDVVILKKKKKNCGFIIVVREVSYFRTFVFFFFLFLSS